MNQTIRQVIIGIDQIDVWQWFKAPLNAAVDIKIFDLCVVLQECCPEQIIWIRKFETGSDYNRFGISIIQGNIIIGKIQFKNAPGLSAIFYGSNIRSSLSIVIPAIFDGKSPGEGPEKIR